MGNQLRVCAGCSILIGVGGKQKKLFKAGEILPDGLLSDKKKITGHVDAGYLEVVRAQTPLTVDDLTMPEKVPGVPDSPAIKSGDSLEDQVQSSKAITVTPPRGATTKVVKNDNAGQDKNKPDSPEAFKVDAPGGITTQLAPKTPADPTTQQTSLWTLDPVALAGRNIDSLNVMILELDQTIQPFETVEEAIAQLSADYVAAV